MSEPRIAIVGAGIGGLALSLALRDKGIPATIYEKAGQLTEIGAAIALSANATRDLERFGCMPGLEAKGCEPTELIYRGWRDQDRIAAHPVRKNGAYRKAFGAPYLGIHRADLQKTMGDRVGRNAIRLGHELTGLIETPDGIRLNFRGEDSVIADLVVGADGIRSRVREHVAGPDSIRYTGTSAFRGIVPVEQLPNLPDPHAIQFWMGPDAHLLHYAIGPDGGDVNYFAVAEGPEEWPDFDRWVIEAAGAGPEEVFAGWDDAVVEMVSAGKDASRWGLFSTKLLNSWHKGRAVLIGDAAHAMLPHHGQGANTAIEDAITLAEMVADRGLTDLNATLTRYRQMRRPRTRAIQLSAAATSDLLHLPDDVDHAGRNARVARFDTDFDWIHGFDTRAAFRDDRIRLRP